MVLRCEYNVVEFMFRRILLNFITGVKCLICKSIGGCVMFGQECILCGEVFCDVRTRIIFLAKW